VRKVGAKGLGVENYGLINIDDTTEEAFKARCLEVLHRFGAT
jgi:hypothetical protein